MKIYRYKTLLALSIIIWFSLQFSIVYPFYFNNTDLRNESLVIHPQAIDRTGKVFSNLTMYEENCYIDRDNPGLNNQPSIFIPNYNISYAKLYFENIIAINYTRNIETEPTEFIISYSETDPIYVYQKFSVETNQYVNNVSIFIQDVIDDDYYSDENSWEVSIVNCSDDLLGTPNSNETLGTLQKPHPIDMVAHWEVFDFKNSDIGPIFLNISKTNWTVVDGNTKYWFAFKVKIPPNDGRTGGGPKFLYLNPDSSDPNDIGEGETFAQSPQFINITYNVDDVKEYFVENGTQLKGNIDSFRNFDDNRFLVNSTIHENRQKIVFYIRLEVDNLTNADYTWDDLKNLRKDEPLEWRNILNSIIFSINISIVINVSDSILIENKGLIWVNPDTGIPNFISPYYINTTHEYESLQAFTAIEPEEKLEVIQHMNTSANGNNSILLIFYYHGYEFVPSDYNASINLLNIEVGEIKTINTIQKYDPIVHDLHYCNNVTLLNSTFITPNDAIIESLKQNDEEILEVEGDPGSNTTIIDFKFNVLPDFDSSLWDVDDPIEWIFSLPNPRIYQIDFRISSNVSIQDTSNLTYAVLEIYNGGDFAPFNETEWIRFSDDKTFADIGENTKILPFDSFYSWYIMHLINESDNNSLKVRLRFIGNGTFTRINVSIDEFTLNFHVQNAFSSDITSKIGFGINNNNLKPSDIFMKNFGTSISDNGIGKGIWEGYIDDAVISQGSFEFNITSLWPAIRFNVNITYEVFKIIPYIEFIDNPASQYSTGSTLFSVRVTEANGKPLSNFEIIFELLNANNNTVYDTTAISNEEGIATASLNFENTGKRFSIRARYAEEGLYTSEEVYSGYIRVVNDYIIFMANFLRVLPYIIIGLAAIVSAVTVRQYRHIQLRKSWAKEAMILDDLLKTSYIMIISKDVGVSIYDKKISLDIDVDLISGFLQAISAFKSEIKKEKEESIIKGKGFEMDYYDFKIVITDGDYIRTALILDGMPSEKLRENQWAFTEHFEKRFEDDLKDFTGDITSFRKADDLIERYFSTSLIHPLQLGKHYEVIKVKGLEKALLEVAEQIQKERKFFFISSLLNFALAGRKASKDEIISVIIDLKRKGLIIPAKIE